jgi:hypothetical protein
VISPKDAAVIAQKAKIKSQKEQATFKSIENGTLDRSMYSDEAFLKRGCEIIDDYFK